MLISGGDPFLLTEERLEELLAPLHEIPHVEMIRIGTRVPVCLPMRVTDALARTLRRYAPVYVVTHFNHPKELTPEAREACERLVDHGVPVENQAVLMRRLNSDARIIKELSHALLRIRVRPYYLHQMDVAEGCEHLRTPIAKGLEILEQLRGHTTGLAVPHLAVDLPGGGGKVTLQPDYVVERGEHETVFRNYKGERYAYPEPEETDCAVPYDAVWQRAGRVSFPAGSGVARPRPGLRGSARRARSSMRHGRPRSGRLQASPGRRVDLGRTLSGRALVPAAGAASLAAASAFACGAASACRPPAALAPSARRGARSPSRPDPVLVHHLPGAGLACSCDDWRGAPSVLISRGLPVAVRRVHRVQRRGLVAPDARDLLGRRSARPPRSRAATSRASSEAARARARLT